MDSTHDTSMSIIHDEVDCPQCGLPANEMKYFIEGQVQTVCPWCGYKKMISGDGTSSNKGFGSVHYCDRNGNHSVKTFSNPLPVGEKTLIIKDIEENYDSSKCKLFEWNNEQKRLVPVIGTVPNTLDERYQEYAMEQAYYDSIKYEGECRFTSDEELEVF